MSNVPLIDLRNARLRKVAKLREKGINPYVSRCLRTHYARSLVDDYEHHEGQTVTVAGRLMSFRDQGRIAFGHVQDQTGRIQLYLRESVLQPTKRSLRNLGFADLNLLDVGDFVEATGTVCRTQRGEISVLADVLRLLTKSLRPLPDKWAGLQDREAVLRRRYLHTTLEPEAKRTFEGISRMLMAIRTFLNERGFLEFLTPALQPQYGGGTAKPFRTRVHALKCDMYLAISHELYLKRLIAAGFDKVYTIGRYFRNEGIDRTHHPEFSMLETMTAYEGYEYNMNLIEDLFRHVAVTAFGKRRCVVRGHEIDFGQPWSRISMVDAVRERAGVDFRACASVEDANTGLASLGISEAQPSVGEALAKAFEVIVGPTLIQPTLVFGHPVEVSPLAKAMDVDSRYAERFEIFIAGMECGDNWSEQNDPVQLLERWSMDAMSTGHGDEAHPIDYDFIEVLEYGIPPTTGIGPGIERMAMIFTGQENIDEVIFFPMMRPSLTKVNQLIYNAEEPLTVVSDTEDMNLSVQDFEALLADQILAPETSRITVRPYLRVWQRPTASRQWKASGYIEIDGFIRHGRLRVVGLIVKSEEVLIGKDEARKYSDLIDLWLTDTIKTKFPECEILMEGAVLLRDPMARDNAVS